MYNAILGLLVCAAIHKCLFPVMVASEAYFEFEASILAMLLEDVISFMLDECASSFRSVLCKSIPGFSKV